MSTPTRLQDWLQAWGTEIGKSLFTWYKPPVQDPLPPLPAPSSVTWITAVAFLSLMPLLPPSLLQSILHSAIKRILLNPMTVHISPLLTTLPWPPAHSVKAKVLTMGYKVLYGSMPLPPSPVLPQLLPVSLTCTTLTTRTSLVYFEQIRHTPTSGS